MLFIFFTVLTDYSNVINTAAVIFSIYSNSFSNSETNTDSNLNYSKN